MSSNFLQDRGYDWLKIILDSKIKNYISDHGLYDPKFNRKIAIVKTKLI